MDNKDIRKAGLKVTLPRIKILELLENNTQRHVGVEDVYKMLLDKGEEVGLATVYRVLTQFETAGLVTRHNFEGGHAVFELDQGGHHDHMVCLVCGKVEEFIDTTIEKRQREIAKEHGFEMVDHSLIIYGHCENPKCQSGLLVLTAPNPTG
ncbi:MAG: ferric iron uptake transcriptional regulator [Candidatus Thiodiazotropha sp. (ex Lucinoma aequizonata)]|nr:ferric iron uptake transcriptional regulator [Candidatus Thiodiazotropha sp. (ex Lucinoma aequizonata)]MCU7887014.1 ferric iron uptake transcriptional regulator [Candidatus Thiodiazotropha sp. (ex Lucinoma aequizonata)]MCU7896792.1 ferric iron uptake transcriptional regulator [Candidatus Thiodiazotropha sp. (ex Lucinoma aequizonata)]MCU7898391.1 ferric iron uptake transcriptional regulator [Candidatus Thiodiazotropha sp. (ex Lucinoma aequizonata)]MCU7901129.1 ferric iron uptake transcription